MPQVTNHLLGLDLGDKRVGVALASEKTKLSTALVTLDNDQNLIQKLKELIEAYSVETVVIGLPRSLNGQDSPQTIKVRQTIEQLTEDLKVKIVAQDEALSSVRAEEELRRRGKIFAKTDIDKLAAALILEDYLAS
jgi:putative holliday junction resolvase